MSFGFQTTSGFRHSSDAFQLTLNRDQVPPKQSRNIAMEEMHKVARAYHDNGTPEVRSLVRQVFCSIDTNNDGWISMPEFIEFLNREGYDNPYINRFLFRELDRDHNGVLDFNEFLTSYYVVKTRNGFCCQCWLCLKGLYFTCVTCFDCADARTFDLCADCYNIENRKTPHPHRNFVDSALLLRARRSASGTRFPGSTSSSQAVEQLIRPATTNTQIQPYIPNVPEPGWIRTRRMVRALEIALAAAAVGIAGVAASCSIM